MHIMYIAFHRLYSNIEGIYFQPWTRFGPYAIGIGLGYVMYKTKCTVKLPKVCRGPLYLRIDQFYSKYSVNNSPLKGDILEELIAKFKKAQCACLLLLQLVVTLCWILSLLGTTISVFGAYKVPEDSIRMVLYITSHRVIFALSIAWIIFACSSGYGGLLKLAP